MPFPIVQSNVPLVFDTLPDLKVRYFRAHGPQDNIYTYAQMYAMPQGLALGLRAFEQTPGADSQIVFALGQPQGSVLRFCLAPGEAALDLLAGGDVRPLSLPEVVRFAGEDEHGWYWGAQLVLPAEDLLSACCTLQAGSAFGIAVLKARAGIGILGASFRLPAGGEPLQPALFDEAVVSLY